MKPVVRPLLIAGYVIVMVLVVWGMFRARRYALHTYGTPAAQQDWDAWVENTKRAQREGGPVQRRVPASDQPPAFVLMTRHFTICLVASLLLSSALYGTIALFLYGAIFQGGTVAPPHEPVAPAGSTQSGKGSR